LQKKVLVSLMQLICNKREYFQSSNSTLFVYS